MGQPSLPILIVFLAQLNNSTSNLSAGAGIRTSYLSIHRYNNGNVVLFIVNIA